MSIEEDTIEIYHLFPSPVPIRSRGAGSGGEWEIILHSRLLNNLSSSPLHPPPCPLRLYLSP